MSRPASYANGFAPRDGMPLYPSLWNGCVGAWCPSLGPTAGDIRDWSGFQRHATLTNMDPGTDWVASNGRWAVDFDGSNDYAATAATDIVPAGAAAKSVSFWFRTTTPASRQWMFYAGTDTTYGRFSIEILSSLLTVNINDAAPSHTATVSSNTWYHAAVSYAQAATSITIWMSGVAVSASISALNTGSSAVYFGVLPPGFFYLSGQLDDVRVYNRALSSQEIALLAQRRGIAYELAPRRLTKSSAVNRRRRSLLRVT